MLYDPNWQKPADIELEPWQKVLLKAADLIEEKGWTQGDFFHGESMCALGAISRAGSQLEEELHGRFSGSAAIKLQTALQGPIACWNDQWGRTKEQVIAKMREVGRGDWKGGGR